MGMPDGVSNILWALIWSIHHGTKKIMISTTTIHVTWEYIQKGLRRPVWRKPSDRGGYRPTTPLDLIVILSSPFLHSYTSFDINRPQAKVKHYRLAQSSQPPPAENTAVVPTTTTTTTTTSTPTPFHLLCALFFPDQHLYPLLRP